MLSQPNDKPDTRMIIVLEARDPESVEIPASFGRRLAVALGEHTRTGDEVESPNRGFGRWIERLSLQNRSVTLALVILLIISNLAFGLGSALQIDQVERPGFSISDRIDSFIGGRNTEGSTAGQDIDQTPAVENTIALYGASFSWPDRFSSVAVQRETASSKVLWPLSTFISMLILTGYLISRSNRELRTSAGD